MLTQAALALGCWEVDYEDGEMVASLLGACAHLDPLDWALRWDEVDAFLPSELLVRSFQTCCAD